MADTSMRNPGDAATEALSYILPFGYNNSSNCGYCRTGKSSKRYSYYATTNSLAPALYQKLVDRCWRRSGTLLYRPNQKQSCCPHYTVRLDSHAFKPSKDQRQAVNRFNNYVLGEDYIKEAARRYPRSREQARKRHQEFDLVERIHEAETHLLDTPLETAHHFAVTLEPDAFTEEKYAVFENYQRLVHKEEPDKITRHGFRRFLCDSPLRRESYTDEDGRERQLGSFHQCYRLDGRLVAMGVLDLLPHCVSAVYFLYHESVQHFNPGKLGALREIALAAECGYRWWYAGYYIHSCPKMRYKIDYAPQYVLDPESLDWHLLDKHVLAVFDRDGYVSMSRERERSADARREPEPASSQNDSIMHLDEAGGSDADCEEDGFLLTSNMPGIPSLGQMQQLDMGNMALRMGSCEDEYVLSDLVIWDTSDMMRAGDLKAKVAELVAAVGPDLMDAICLDFCSRKDPD